ncbi:MAG: hypothetical protein LIP01_13305 [Tannerellaceae bacterium]|nr:hypothetical protein [Tannerellaceae bacterium]
MENIHINSMGHGTKEDAAITLKEYANWYPENRMYGYIYPSSGLFFRHIQGLTLKNITLEVRNKDFRPSILFEDVTDYTMEGVENKEPV